MTNSQTRDSFIFYRSFYEAIQDLPKENQLELYNAIAQYSLNFEDPTLNGLSNTIFKLIKPQLDANNKRFINGQKGAEHGKKGAEHGKKGGRPRKETPLNIKNNPPKNPPNNNVNVNENNNVNKNENKLTIQKENPFADMTKEFLQVRYKQMRKDKTITQKDFDNIRRLIEIDLKNRNNPIDDVKKAMDCVNKNSDKEFFPAIESSKAFREKFTKIESYIKRNGISNQQNSISKEEDKKRRLKAINEIAGKKLFKSCQQLQSNDERVFLFLKNEDDREALQSLPKNKRNEIKAILGDILTDKELSIQIANFHIN